MLMKLISVLPVVLTLLGLEVLAGVSLARAESTMICPSGTYDMLDWMTMDSDLRSHSHLTGSANPLYSTIWPEKFYWTKGGNGSPWDIQLYDSQYIYLWITEYGWNDPSSYKKFSNNTNLPLAPRCARGGFPGSTLKISNTSYDIHTSCTSFSRHDLKKGLNEVWGPYRLSFGGSLPSNMPTLVVSYRYNCDTNYGNCGDKEEYYLSQRYGLVQWVHYSLIGGRYEQQQKSVFNKISAGNVVPKFQCF
jgi:hypothetical protein